MRTRATTVLLAPLLVVALGACTQAKSAGGSAITVDASDDACTMSTSTTTTGDREFRITNTGTKVTEFYVLTEDGMVVSEVENLTPGMTRSLHVTLKRPAGRRVLLGGAPDPDAHRGVGPHLPAGAGRDLRQTQAQG